MKQFSLPRRAFVVCLIFLMILILDAQPGNAYSSSDTNPSNNLNSIDYYGKSIDILKLFGQLKISETGRNLVNGNGIYHASGILVDRNSPLDRLYIYVVDTGNNRILGFNFNCAHGNTCQMDGSKSADIVLGQPDMTTASCNGDNNLGFNQPPTASTLCLQGYPFANNTAESWTRVNIDVDNQGNLYVPDFWNNRVLKFNQPFSADKTAGKGDAIADFVWGQDNMISNGRNRGSNYGAVNLPDNHSLWISFGGPYFDHVTSRGVSVDNSGNVWVADTFNNRILRFTPNSKVSDLVLGQPNFTSSGCNPNGPLNKMCTPTLARVHPTTGDLYVLDEYPGPFFARILVYRPPFTNGMTAYRTIIPNQGGQFSNWEGWDGLGTYRFQSTGFVFNTYKQGEYANGEIWLNEHQANRTLLIDFDGNIVKVIGAQNKYLRGGDSVYYPECGSIYEGNHLWWPGGSIGIDNANNIYLADEFFHTIYRYALPYNPYQAGSVTCLPYANGVLFPKGPNQQSSDRLGESVGLAVSGNQLLVRDEGMRIKVYNNYQVKAFGANADYVLTGGFQGRNWLSGGIDDANRLWLSGEHGQIRIYQLPITSNVTIPIKDFVKLYWADTGLEVMRPDGTGYVQVGAMAFDPVGHAMYLVDAAGTRIFRVKNYNQFATTLFVDLVIGQRNKTEVRCNQGLSSPNAETLCNATQIKFDKHGNLFVVDNGYECHDNRRIVVFESSDLNNATTLFPNLQAQKVFNAPSFNQIGNCAYWTVDQPGSPVSLAFNSKNQMVVGNDGYYGDASQRQLKQLWFYSDPLAKQTPDASIDIYMGTPGDIVFDANDNLLIQDHTWSKVWMINLSCDPEWLSFLPGATIPELPPCVMAQLPDLDVAYIARIPRYDYDAPKNFPAQGDTITFEAHIANRGGQAISNFNYSWYIDGVIYYHSTYFNLAPNEVITLTINWVWQVGPHKVRITLDPDNNLPEISEQNNSVEDQTNALAVGLWVEQSLYDYFNIHQVELGIGSVSWDDWAQRQIRVWNQMFISAITPLTPQGIIDRVRLDKVTVVPDGSLSSCNFPAPSDKTIDLQWGFTAAGVGVPNSNDCGNPNFYFVHPEAQNVEYSLMHELSHARYLIDIYGLSVYAYSVRLTTVLDSSATTLIVNHNVEQDGNFPLPSYLALEGELIICQSKVSNTFQNCTRGAEGTNARLHSSNSLVNLATVRLQDGNGNLIQGSTQLPTTGYLNDVLYMNRYPDDVMVGGTEYKQHSAFAWNRIAGQRPVCGNANPPCNFGVYLNDLPEHNVLEVYDSDGQLLQGAMVEVFVGKPFPTWYGKIFTSPSNKTYLTDSMGRVDLGSTPFGEGNVIHGFGHSTAVILIKISSGGQSFYRFFDVTEANEAYWFGKQSMAIYPIATMLSQSTPLQRTFLPLIIKRSSDSNNSVYFSSLRDGNSEIYRYDFNFSGLERITNNPANDRWAVASPNGREICFESDRTGNLEIFCSDASGNNQVNITNMSGDDGMPRFSPDGTLIAYHRREEDSSAWEIWVMNANGTNKRRLTYENSYMGEPNWFPDGTKLVFDGNKPDRNILVINLDGTGLAVINDKFGEQRSPSVSPYGHIYYDSSENGRFQIYRMESDGSHQTPITFGLFDNVLPQISPDGQWITFTSNRDNGDWEIYLMGTDKKKPKRLTISLNTDEGPSWSPSSSVPYSIDTHTTLLLHFDGSYSGAQGEPGAPNGTTFTKGKYDQGVLINSNNALTYVSAGNINRTQGSIEFWIKPNWDGDDGQGYTFFEVGDAWFNRIRIMKDGANNLRFMLWDSVAEYGVGYNVASWNAGEWHHIAATWEGSHIALYVDGQLRESSNTARPPDMLAATMFIGSSMWHDQQANAVIDEIRISDIARIGNSEAASLAPSPTSSCIATATAIPTFGGQALTRLMEPAGTATIGWR